MAPATAKCIHISPLGLSDLQNQVLRVAINLLAQEGIEYQILDANNPSGQLLVVDNDTDSGRYVLTQAKKAQVKLAFSSENQSGKNLVTLKKPIRVGALKELLGAIHRKVSSVDHNLKNNVTPVHKQQDVPEIEPSPSLPERTLLSILLDAKRQHQSLHLLHENLGNIFINTSEQTYASTKNAVYVDQLAAISINELQFKKINAHTFNQSVKQLEIHALNGLLWRIGMHCSGGILMAGHEVDKLIRLKAWPNFTRNSFNPQHLKIAAVMARQPTTLMHLKEAVNLPLAEVVNFYNAALMIDLIDENPSNAIEVQCEVKEKVNIGLLKKLAERLGFG